MLKREDEKRVVLNIERLKYWISKGATPSDRVQLFLANVGLAEKPAMREQPVKSAPRAKAQERAKAAAEAAAKAGEAAPPELAS
jgi:small subunit ribosomal protein S16